MCQCLNSYDFPNTSSLLNVPGGRVNGDLCQTKSSSYLVSSISLSRSFHLPVVLGYTVPIHKISG